MEATYGKPVVHRLAFPLRASEFALLRRSMQWGRCHDTTILILDGTRVVVTRKPSYPAGVYRPPSGGVSPGETLEDGTLREAYEETGLRIQLARYLMRALVDFRYGNQLVHWTTHVFTASVVGGFLEPVDTHEIIEARWAELDSLRTSLRDGLMAAGSLGLFYRADLQYRALDALWKAKVKHVGGIQEDFMD